MKIQYQIEHLIDDDLLSCEIEFTEEKAIETAKKIMSFNKEKNAYILISKLEKDNRGFYSTIEQDYITIKHNKKNESI
jgi:hypothetical protein